MYLSLIVALMLALGGRQSTPDFTGTWQMIPDRSGSPQQSEPVTSMTFVIAQAPDEIRIDVTTAAQKTISSVYPFGPVPKQPSEPLSAGQSIAYWKGNQLIVERGGTINGQTVSAKQTLTLNPEKSELTVERLVIVQHGYTLKGTPNYATVTDVFARAR